MHNSGVFHESQHTESLQGKLPVPSDPVQPDCVGMMLLLSSTNTEFFLEMYSNALARTDCVPGELWSPGCC